MTSATLFELDGVVVEGEGGARIIDAVDLAVPDDGVTVVAGPSGSGKSTLLRLLNRLEVPSVGTVRFRGADVAELDPLAHRRRVGMVFQQAALFPGTVRDNLHVADPRAGDDALVAALGRAALEPGFLDRDADQLSGGEAQRACLARTLVTHPEVLLMDEPTSALDPAATRQLEELACAAARDGVPVVWVTHDLPQIGRIADRCVVLDHGRIADEAGRAAYLAGGTP